MNMKRNFWIYPLALMGTIAICLSNCKKEKTEPVVKLPLVTTAEVVDLTSNSATSGGNVLEDGGGAITARGVVWATFPNPSITDKTGITNDGTGVGVFTSYLTGLESETKYYVKAYATNSAGTAYGDEKNFTTPPPLCSNCLKDTVGNVYHWVQIGTQDWMVENLRTTKYNDGTPIQLVTGDHDWAVLDTATGGAYCYYNNDADTYKETYGAIYNFAAVRTGKLAPKGWRVPSREDWLTLMEYLGGTDVAGGKLKETDTIPNAGAHWNPPNTGATDEYGFKGLPGGFRYARADYDAIWAGINTHALYQTTTTYDGWPDNGSYNGEWSYYAILWFDKAALNIPYWNKQAGCSVKCVRDHK